MKEFERQKKSDEQDLQDIAEAENKKKLEKFMNTEIRIGSKISKLLFKVKVSRHYNVILFIF